MCIKEIMNIEGSNAGRIYLHREGLFWKACERSAFAFVTHYTPYKVSKRHYKAINGDMVSLGFPDAMLGKLFAPGVLTQVDARQFYAVCPPVDESVYASWRAAIPLEQQARTPAVPAEPPPQFTELEQMILDFDLNREVPLACMNFVQKLKRFILKEEE